MSYTDYDAASLASAMVTAERAGMDSMLSAKNTKYTTQVSGLESLESLLKNFQTSLDTFEDDTSLSAQTTSLSDDDYFSVTSDGTAATGQYSITVEQLAQSYQSAMEFSSSSAAIPTSGTLSITANSKTLTVDLSKVSGGTVADLVTYINKQTDNPGVKASLVTSSGKVNLMITSDDTGTKAGVTNMTFTSSDGATVSVDKDGNKSTSGTLSSDTTSATYVFQNALQNLTQMSVAQDAKIKLGTTSTIEITSSSNTMKNAIDGLTITLKKSMSSSDSPVTTVVKADTDTVATNLKTWVTSFNSLVTSLKKLYDDGGSLEGNSTVRSIISSLKTTLRSSLPEGTSLSDVGLKFSSDGTLSVDSDALKTALTSDPDILNKVFTDDGGVFDDLDDFLEPYTKSGGILATSQQSAQDNLDSVKDRQEKWNTKMTNLYKTYLAQFNTMIATMATLESNATLL